MRFKSQIKNVSVFAKFCASLASLHHIAWCRLNDDDVRFTVLPERGSQAWCVLKLDTVFDTYIIQSAAPKNTINLEVPIQALQRALRSALRATSVQLRLTKKENVPMLSLTIVTNTVSSGNGVVSSNHDPPNADELVGVFDLDDGLRAASFGSDAAGRETIITQDVPVKVLPMQSVSHLHEPSCPSSDVNIFLPHLAQVKALLELSANMHGSFQIAVKTDTLSIASRWTGLSHPELDASMFPNGSQGVRDDPSSRKKELGGPDGQDPAGWTAVRIDAKDWSRVLSVGRLNSRVIATFIPDHGLVLYVYLPAEDEGSEESVLTLTTTNDDPF
ncbi:hypothetical protein DV737_g258, partial [Chaetothyriales sp. CBS 132003]